MNSHAREFMNSHAREFVPGTLAEWTMGSNSLCVVLDVPVEQGPRSHGRHPVVHVLWLLDPEGWAYQKSGPSLETISSLSLVGWSRRPREKSSVNIRRSAQ